MIGCYVAWIRAEMICILYENFGLATVHVLLLMLHSPFPLDTYVGMVLVMGSSIRFYYTNSMQFARLVRHVLSLQYLRQRNYCAYNLAVSRLVHHWNPVINLQ